MLVQSVVWIWDEMRAARLILCLFVVAVVGVSTQSVENEASLTASVKSLLDHGISLPEDTNLPVLLAEPIVHKPFAYHHDFMKDPDDSSYFSYDHQHERGPHNWQRYFKDCGGRNQSPINIRTRTCVPSWFQRPLTYPNSEMQPSKVTVENNGYSSGYPQRVL